MKTKGAWVAVSMLLLSNIAAAETQIAPAVPKVAVEVLADGSMVVTSEIGQKAILSRQEVEALFKVNDGEMPTFKDGLPCARVGQ